MLLSGFSRNQKTIGFHFREIAAFFRTHLDDGEFEPRDP